MVEEEEEEEEAAVSTFVPVYNLEQEIDEEQLKPVIVDKDDGGGTPVPPVLRKIAITQNGELTMGFTGDMQFPGDWIKKF